MRDRIIAIVLIALVALPASTGAQDAPVAEVPGATEGGLLERLCSADVADEASLAACLVTVAASLAGAARGDVPDLRPSAAPHDLLDRARQVVDETLEEALTAARGAGQQVDLQAVVDEALAAAQDVDLQAVLEAALDEALQEPLADAAEVDVQAVVEEALATALDAAGEVDLRTALDDAIAGAQAVELDAALDEALEEALARADETLAAVGDVDAQALLDGGLGTPREVIAAAQAWIVENSDTVCKGGSLSVGTSAAAVVAYLTGSPGLAIRAFEETERLSNDICGDVAR